MAVSTLADTVKKVDRAVARLEELQSTIKSTNLHKSGGRETALRSQQRVGGSGREWAGQENKRRGAAPRGGRGGNRGEWRQWSAPAGVVQRATANIVDASQALVHDSGKENAGCEQTKQRKQVTRKIYAQVGDRNVESLPGTARRRRGSNSNVLTARASNVEAPPLLSALPVSHPSSSPSGESCFSGESKRVHVANSSSESVGGDVSVQRENHDFIRPAVKLLTPRREARPITRRSSRSSSGSARLSGTAPRPRRLSAAACTAVPPLESPASCTSPPPPRARITRSTAPAPPLSSLPVPKTFCVHVRPDPTRPWRLSSSASASTDTKPRRPSKPVYMFPNPTFAPSSSSTNANPPSSAKLAPFKSFQLKPLSIPQQQDSINTPPATVRPYLSPSKASPKQQSGSCNSPSSLVNRSSRQHFSSTVSFAEIDPSNKGQQHGSENGNTNTKNWWSRRLSLPTCRPSKAIRRFSINGNQEGSPVRPLPTLISRLPSRRKPRQPIHSFSPQTTNSTSSVTVSEAQRGANRRENTAANPGTPVSPLPLPPALQLEGYQAAAHARGNSARTSAPHPIHKRSLSCPRRDLGPLDGNSSLVKEDDDVLGRVRAGSVGKENFMRQAGEKESRKNILSVLDCGRFPCCSASVWPAMTRSWSFSYARSCDSCTGAGPSLVQHVKGWIHSKKD